MSVGTKDTKAEIFVLHLVQEGMKFWYVKLIHEHGDGLDRLSRQAAERIAVQPPQARHRKGQNS